MSILEQTNISFSFLIFRYWAYLASAPQNLRIYSSLRIFSNKEILKFDWLRTQIWANKVCSAKKKFCGIGAWWKLFPKHVVCTKFDIYVFIKMYIRNVFQQFDIKFLLPRLYIDPLTRYIHITTNWYYCIIGRELAYTPSPHKHTSRKKSDTILVMKQYHDVRCM